MADQIIPNTDFAAWLQANAAQARSLLGVPPFYVWGPFYAQILNPSDAFTLYMGASHFAFNVASHANTYPPAAGTITGARINAYSAFVPASGESLQFYLHKNNADVATLADDCALTEAGLAYTKLVAGLNIPIEATDFACIKIVFPTWATNPNTVAFRVDLLVQPASEV